MRAFSRKLKSLTVGSASVTIDNASVPESRFQFERLLGALRLPNSKKLVVMIDEYPEVIENVCNDFGEKSAVEFIQGFTDIRKNPNLAGRVQFIVTGSIGLEEVVAKLKKTQLIADLKPVYVEPLTSDEGRELVLSLVAGLEFEIGDEEVSHLLSLIGWITPYYVQIFVSELKDLTYDSPGISIDSSHLSSATSKIVKKDLYFSHWRERLDSILLPDDRALAVHVLTALSEVDCLLETKLLDLLIAKLWWS